MAATRTAELSGRALRPGSVALCLVLAIQAGSASQGAGPRSEPLAGGRVENAFESGVRAARLLIEA